VLMLSPFSSPLVVLPLALLIVIPALFLLLDKLTTKPCGQETSIISPGFLLSTIKGLLGVPEPISKQLLIQSARLAIRIKRPRDTRTRSG
jgi:hypothetical protein